MTTRKKSGEKSRGRPGTFTGKADPRNGRGPQKGAPNAGRPPLAFAQECARLQREVILPKCRAALGELSTNDPAWRWAADYVSRYGELEAIKQLQVIEGSGVLVVPTPVTAAEWSDGASAQQERLKQVKLQ